MLIDTCIYEGLTTAESFYQDNYAPTHCNLRHQHLINNNVSDILDIVNSTIPSRTVKKKTKQTPGLDIPTTFIIQSSLTQVIFHHFIHNTPEFGWLISP